MCVFLLCYNMNNRLKSGGKGYFYPYNDLSTFDPYGSISSGRLGTVKVINGGSKKKKTMKQKKTMKRKKIKKHNTKRRKRTEGGCGCGKSRFRGGRRKNKKTRKYHVKQKKYGKKKGGNFLYYGQGYTTLPQNLMNVGSNLSYNAGSMYADVQGNEAPVNPSVVEDQFSNVSNNNTRFVYDPINLGEIRSQAEQIVGKI